MKGKIETSNFCAHGSRRAIITHRVSPLKSSVFGRGKKKSNTQRQAEVIRGNQFYRRMIQD